MDRLGVSDRTVCKMSNFSPSFWPVIFYHFVIELLWELHHRKKSNWFLGSIWTSMCDVAVTTLVFQAGFKLILSGLYSSLNWGRKAAFTLTSVNSTPLVSSRIRMLNRSYLGSFINWACNSTLCKSARPMARNSIKQMKFVSYTMMYIWKIQNNL